MTSHELARQLLALPDVVVIGSGVGQGSNECGDADLTRVEFKSAVSFTEPACIELIF